MRNSNDMPLAHRLLSVVPMRWCLISLLAACIGAEDAPDPVELPLTSLPGFTLRVDAADTGLNIDLTTADEYTLPCSRLLPSFVATLDGEPLSVERGYVWDGGLDSPEYVCELPHVYTTLRGQVLHIADDHATFDIDLGDAAAYRTMQVPTTAVARGDTFDITWSSSMDLVNLPAVEVYVNDVEATVAIDAGGIHVTTPSASELAPTGTLPIDVRVTSSRPCPYPNCKVLAVHKLRQTITVQ